MGAAGPPEAFPAVPYAAAELWPGLGMRWAGCAESVHGNGGGAGETSSVDRGLGSENRRRLLIQ